MKNTFCGACRSTSDLVSVVHPLGFLIDVHLPWADDVWCYWLWRYDDADDAGHMAMPVTITAKISHALAMARVVVLVAVVTVARHNDASTVADQRW